MLYEIHPLLALTYRVQPVVVREHLRVLLPTLASCGVPPIGYTAAITLFSAPSTFTDDERGVATRPSTPVVVSVCVAGAGSYNGSGAGVAWSVAVRVSLYPKSTGVSPNSSLHCLHQPQTHPPWTYPSHAVHSKVN